MAEFEFYKDYIATETKKTIIKKKNNLEKVHNSN